MYLRLTCLCKCLTMYTTTYRKLTAGMDLIICNKEFNDFRIIIFRKKLKFLLKKIQLVKSNKNCRSMAYIVCHTPIPMTLLCYRTSYDVILESQCSHRDKILPRTYQFVISWLLYAIVWCHLTYNSRGAWHICSSQIICEMLPEIHIMQTRFTGKCRWWKFPVVITGNYHPGKYSNFGRSRKYWEI